MRPVLAVLLLLAAATAKNGPDVVQTAPVPITELCSAHDISHKFKGDVFLRVKVDKDGKVQDVVVSRSLRPDMDKAAVDSVRQWVFKPAKDERQINMAVQFDCRLKKTSK